MLFEILYSNCDCVSYLTYIWQYSYPSLANGKVLYSGNRPTNSFTGINVKLKSYTAFPLLAPSKAGDNQDSALTTIFSNVQPTL
jgi:hypothetical protein